MGREGVGHWRSSPSSWASVPGWGTWLTRRLHGTNTAQLLIVAFYSLTTFFLLNEGFKKMISWVPQRTTGKDGYQKGRRGSNRDLIAEPTVRVRSWPLTLRNCQVTRRA